MATTVFEPKNCEVIFRQDDCVSRSICSLSHVASQFSREQMAFFAARYLHDRCEISKPLENTGTSRFHSVRPAPISMTNYMKRISDYSDCSAECFVMALIYIEKFICEHDMLLTFRNAHRLLITAVMVAAKLRDDFYYSNDHYASIGGVSNVELNELELEFLQGIGWSGWVEPDTYKRHVNALAKQYNEEFWSVSPRSSSDDEA